MKIKNLLIAMSTLLVSEAFAQPQVNYDESAIAPYELPDLLTTKNGKSVGNMKEWEHQRRKEILALFETEMFGKVPHGKIGKPEVVLQEQKDNVLNGKASRQQFALKFNSNGHEITINILLYLPVDVENPPVFVGYNFYGNHTILDDPAIILTDAWIDNNKEFGITEHKANDASRGVRHSRWPVSKIIEGGFGLATIYYGDVDPDRNNFSDGLHPLFYKNGQTKPAEDEWGAIAAWSWGASRVLDQLKSLPRLSGSKFIMFGHSRLGKAALWAGAMDQRFDAVISNDSGCGGAALSRRKFGETVEIINTSFPHWFAGNFKKYNEKEEELPFDQHELIALIAPRPVYIASAAEDLWADPKGEYLSGYYATPVYELYGKTGLIKAEPPAIGEPMHGTGIGYHVRPGGHDVKEYDWEQYMVFLRNSLH